MRDLYPAAEPILCSNPDETFTLFNPDTMAVAVGPAGIDELVATIGRALAERQSFVDVLVDALDLASSRAGHSPYTGGRESLNADVQLLLGAVVLRAMQHGARFLNPWRMAADEIFAHIDRPDPPRYRLDRIEPDDNDDDDLITDYEEYEC